MIERERASTICVFSTSHRSPIQLDMLKLSCRGTSTPASHLATPVTDAQKLRHIPPPPASASAMMNHSAVASKQEYGLRPQNFQKQNTASSAFESDLPGGSKDRSLSGQIFDRSRTTEANVAMSQHSSVRRPLAEISAKGIREARSGVTASKLQKGETETSSGRQPDQQMTQPKNSSRRALHHVREQSPVLENMQAAEPAISNGCKHEKQISENAFPANIAQKPSEPPKVLGQESKSNRSTNYATEPNQGEPKAVISVNAAKDHGVSDARPKEGTNDLRDQMAGLHLKESKNFPNDPKVSRKLADAETCDERKLKPVAQEKQVAHHRPDSSSRQDAKPQIQKQQSRQPSAMGPPPPRSR